MVDQNKPDINFSYEKPSHRVLRYWQKRSRSSWILESAKRIEQACGEIQWGRFPITVLNNPHSAAAYTREIWPMEDSVSAHINLASDLHKAFRLSLSIGEKKKLFQAIFTHEFGHAVLAELASQLGEHDWQQSPSFVATQLIKNDEWRAVAKLFQKDSPDLLFMEDGFHEKKNAPANAPGYPAGQLFKELFADAFCSRVMMGTDPSISLILKKERFSSMQWREALLSGRSGLSPEAQAQAKEATNRLFLNDSRKMLARIERSKWTPPEGAHALLSVAGVCSQDAIMEIQRRLRLSPPKNGGKYDYLSRIRAESTASLPGQSIPDPSGLASRLSQARASAPHPPNPPRQSKGP